MRDELERLGCCEITGDLLVGDFFPWISVRPIMIIDDLYRCIFFEYFPSSFAVRSLYVLDEDSIVPHKISEKIGSSIFR